jgi:hypothetical protein
METLAKYKGKDGHAQFRAMTFEEAKALRYNPARSS